MMPNPLGFITVNPAYSTELDPTIYKIIFDCETLTISVNPPL